MLKVEPIQNGVVIDHIPAGRGMEIYRLLHLESKHQAVALLQSVRSEKYGTKDLIKIEGSNLPERLEILGYLDRRITLIYIKDGVVERKCQPDMPEILRNVVKCTNPRCITSIEAGCDHIFKLSPSGSTAAFTVIRNCRYRGDTIWIFLHTKKAILLCLITIFKYAKLTRIAVW